MSMAVLRPTSGRERPQAARTGAPARSTPVQGERRRQELLLQLADPG